MNLRPPAIYKYIALGIDPFQELIEQHEISPLFDLLFEIIRVEGNSMALGGLKNRNCKAKRHGKWELTFWE